MKAPILNIRKLSLYRGKTFILRSLDWRIEAKQHWVILGSNGSGKTSLLSSLCGYLMPSSGEIQLLGQTYGESDWRELRKKIGLVSSSIRQQIEDGESLVNVIISGKYATLNHWERITAKDRREALTLLNQVGLFCLKDSYWAYLSQGERQRALIARALMAHPEILILDEPCAGLDPVVRQKFLKFVNQMGRSKKRTTLVLVTHHIEEITGCFTHLLLLKNGRVLDSGKITKTLHSQNISHTFGVPLKVSKVKGSYRILE
ncbi:MAG: ABC transporter ATP-binding protein [Verrucomicrobiota bacterium]